MAPKDAGHIVYLFIDTPHAILHVKMTLSSKTPKSDFEDMVSLDSVIQVRIE